MDPIATSVFTGLVTQALGSAAGSLPRVVRSRRRKEVKSAVGDLNASAQSFLLPALASLADTVPDAYDVLGRFLGSVEAETFVRSLACAALSDKLKDVRADLHDQLVALLVLVAGAERDAAEVLAGRLFALFAQTIEVAARRLARADRTLSVAVSDRAKADLHSGALDGLTQRSRMLRHHGPGELADFLAFADRYRRLLHDRTSELVPAYFDVQRRVPIDQHYITPTFTFEQQTEPLESLLAKAYRTVILGAPGAGKSTLVQHLAHRYAKPGPGGFGIVPFVVTLRTYEEWKNEEHGSVIDFLAATILENYQLAVPQGAIDHLLLTGRGFVLFDGLDELLNIGKRQAICDVIANFADLYATTTVLVTSRVVGYAEAPINPTRFGTATLNNFTAQDVARYVTNWFTADVRLDPRTRTAMIQSFLDESASVSDIRSNALMLGLMCNLYRGIRTIPENRADLYEKCASMLFERWDAGRGIATSNVLKADAKAALQDIALWMYTSEELSDGVTERQLTGRLAAFWSKRFEDPVRAMDVAKELVELWKGRTWVLTDVGSTGATPGLVYKFTHQTFLEFFAAVELVRRNATPEALWEVLRIPVAEGGWEIVAQLAIQKLDEFHLDAADKVVTLLAEAAGPHLAGFNLLAFAARNVGNLYATPKTLRTLTTHAVDLPLAIMPAMSPIPTSREYGNCTERELRTLAKMTQIGQRDLWQPLFRLLATDGERQRLAIDQMLQHGSALLDGDNAATAFVFLLVTSRLEELPVLPGEFIDEDLELALPAELWNIADIERRLGREITPAQVMTWGGQNFWAAVLGCRAGLISVDDMVRSAGVATLACAADPFMHLGTPLVEWTPLADLLVAYLNTGTGGRETLATVGRELDAGVPTFDGSWLAPTLLYGKVVRRDFIGTAAGTPAGTQPVDPNQDSLFGAAVLLAVVIELEKWDLLDYSEDQLGSLSLGPLQVLEPIYMARRTEGFWGIDIDAALANTGLSAARRKVLSNWARKRIDFTVR